MKAKRVTLNRVNEAIKSLGYELVRGDGYFYFWPLKKSNVDLLWCDSVATMHLSGWTVEEWKKELEEKIEETRLRRF